MRNTKTINVLAGQLQNIHSELSKSLGEDIKQYGYTDKVAKLDKTILELGDKIIELNDII